MAIFFAISLLGSIPGAVLANTAPNAVDDADVETVEDNATFGNVLANDEDADGDTLTASEASDPPHGSVTLDPTGIFTYTPDADYFGTDTFTYRATDTTGLSDVATVAITVSPVNDRPAAVSQASTTDEDTAKTVTLTATDPDPDTHTFKITSLPANGRLYSGSSTSAARITSVPHTLSGNQVTYLPNSDYSSPAPDTFQFKASDAALESTNTATVSMTVAAVNDAPTATAQSVTTDEDTAKSVILAATDPDTAATGIGFRVTSLPAHGSLYDGGTATGTAITSEQLPYTVTDPAHQVTYKPDLNYNNTSATADTFGFVANDGNASSAAPATVSVTVSPKNDLPAAVPQNVTTAEDTAKPITLGVSDPDTGDTHTYQIVGRPANGTLYEGASANGAPVPNGALPFTLTGNQVTYVPNANSTQADSFTYRVNDTELTIVPGTAATVSIAVTPVNDAPSFTKGANQTVSEDAAAQSVSGWATAISAGPADESTQTVTFTTTNDNNGLFAVQPEVGPTGTLTYTLAPDANGSSTVTVTLSDDGGASSAAQTFTITVNAVNDAPSFVKGGDQTTAEDAGAQSVPAWATGLSAGPANESSQTLTFTATNSNNSLFSTQPAIASDGTLTYTPAANKHGTATVTVTLSDSGGTSNGGVNSSPSQTFTITVGSVNDAPTATAQSLTTNEDTAKAVTLAGTDIDVPADTLSFKITSLPTKGTLHDGADASAPAITAGDLPKTLTGSQVTYKPTQDSNGADSFTFAAHDGQADSAPATVSATVTAVNDLPAALAQDVTAEEDTAKTITLGASDPDNTSHTFRVTSLPTNGTLRDGGATGPRILSASNDVPFTLTGSQVTYTPNTDSTAADSFTFRANDGQTLTDGAPATVSIVIGIVNDPPSFTKGANETVNEDAAAQSVSGWATAISAGPGETGTLTFTTTNDNNGLFSAQPSVSPTGDLTYTPAQDANGSSTVTVTLSDDGGASSAPQTFTITVNAVNDAPSFTKGADQTTNEDTGAQAVPGWATGLSTGPANESSQTLTFTVSNDNSALFSGQPAVNSAGNLSYTPAANKFGTATVTVTLSDSGNTSNGGDNTSDPQTFTITVTGVNDAPTATAQSQSTAEDTAKTLTLAATDIDSSTFSFVVTSLPTRGALYDGATATGTAITAQDLPRTLSGNQATYLPNQDYNGADSFGFTANDGQIDSSPALASLTVTAVNDAPVANDDPGAGEDPYQTNTGDPLTVSATDGVLANDTDVDGDSLTALAATQPAHGTVVVNPNGSFTYTPNDGYSGSDSFTYTANDNGTLSDTGQVSILVTALNLAPIAENDSHSTAEDNALTVPAPGVLVNDRDPERQALTVDTSVVDEPDHGTVQLGSNGSFTYTPAANYNGPDSFEYRVTDPAGDADTAVVTINVTSVNDAPVGAADAYSTDEDVVLSKSATDGVLANDTDVDAGDARTAVLVVRPAHAKGPGLDGFTLNNDGSFSYTPAAEYSGPDSFTYRVRDASGALSATTTVSLTVNAVDDLPVAADDAYTVAEDAAELRVNAPGVLTNDSDVDGPTPTVSRLVAAPNPAKGRLTSLGGNGSFVYKPNANFAGTDSFTYRVGDPNTGDVATVTITVTQVNDAPVANADGPYSGSENTTLTIPAADGLLANDRDVENNTLTASKVTNPANGTATVNSNGSFSYTPNSGYSGTDTFTYKANDGTVDSTPATVSITIGAVNDPPRFTKGANQTVNEDAGAQTLTGWATNVDAGPGETGTVTFETTNTNSELFSAEPAVAQDGQNGTLTYTPAANKFGSATVTVTATDGEATSAPQTFTITVNPVNDAPTAIAAAVTTPEDTNKTITLEATDVDDASHTFKITSLPTNGKLYEGTSATGTEILAASATVPHTLSADKVTYTPNQDSNGPDAFTFLANDGDVDSSSATISIGVNAVNDAPSFTKGDNATVAEDSGEGSTNQWPKNVKPGPDTATDESSQTVTFETTNDNNGLFSAQPTVSGPQNTLSYRPAPNKFGVAKVSVTAKDSGGASSAPQEFTITITSVNDAPVAANDSYTVAQGSTLTRTAPGVLANDSDVESQQLTAAVATRPSNGTLAENSDGSFTYTPNANFSGTDTFTYKATDTQNGESNLATVTITVGRDTVKPVATMRALPTFQVNSNTFTISWSATDNASGVASYNVRYRSAAYGASFGTTYTGLVTRTTATSRSFSGTPGTEYCFSVLAYDNAGNYSAYSPEACTAPALDDRSLTRTGTWSSVSSSSYYLGTASRSTAANATLTRTNTRFRQLSLLATTCSTCGTVEVRLNGALLKSVPLTSSTTQNRRLISVVPSSTADRTGTITVKVIGSGKAVVIDGLALSHR